MAKKFYTNEEVTKKFESLPKEVKDMLYSFEMTSIITKVGEKNSLHVDQLDTLNTEAEYVMMGLTDTKDFPGIIMEDLGIDQAKADAVARDVNDMLFEKIRSAMGKTSENPTPATAPTTNKILAPINPPAMPSSSPATPIPPAPKLDIPQVAPPAPAKIDPADMMLTQKTVATPTVPAPSVTTPPSSVPPATKVEPPKPGDYRADPYREPTI